MVACIFFFTIIMCMVIGANSNSGCGIKCFSLTCKHNKGGKCGRKEIVVYDNTVKGLCLNHTDNMNNRVIKPMESAGFHEEHCVTVTFSDKAQEKIKDEVLLKNPKAFSSWMKKHGME